jgi:hypothetical protein
MPLNLSQIGQIALPVRDVDRAVIARAKGVAE